MIRVCTYNIQFSLHPDQIQQNILLMVEKGATIVCLQEVIPTDDKNIIKKILQKLGNDWKATSHLGEEKNMLGMGNCIIWNTQFVKLINKKNILLPYSGTLSFPEKIVSWLTGGITVPFRRRALIAHFKHQNREIRVTNVHLDHNGGTKNRCHQLKYVVDILQRTDRDLPEVICGDFNNLDLLGDNQELNKYYEILQGYKDATLQIDWTADLYSIDTTTGYLFLQTLIKKSHLHIRKKLDFIWVKNIHFSHPEKMLLPGSDHLPVIVSLD